MANAQPTGSDRFVLQRRALDSIAQGALTNSKRPECFVKGVYPTHLKRGQGCWVWDHHGTRYLDFICGLGTNLLGYAHTQVNQAMMDQMAQGASLSLSTHVEVEAAEMLKSMFPFVDCVKFLKTGSEACTSAIKIARAFQGVEYGDEELHEMWLGKAIRDRLSSEAELSRRTQARMQGLHQGLSESAAYHGDQTTGSAQILEESVGSHNRNASRPEATREDQGSGAGQGVLRGPGRTEKWNARKAAVRDLWRSQYPSASPRLFEAFGREMALSHASRRGTPKWLVLSEGYHGHHAQFNSLTAPACGVPIDWGMLDLKDNWDLIKIAAAVIVEPIITDASPERIAWLHQLREECTKHGALLIFDEVITGFRFPKFSVSNYHGVTPDLICLGKAIANGMPLAAVGGKYAVMNGKEYFVSSSYAGETISLAAAKKTMELLLSNKADLNLLWKKGEAFYDFFNSLYPEKIRLVGYPTRGRFAGDPKTIALFFQETCLAGMLFGPSWFLSFPAAEELDNVRGAIRAIMGRISRGEVELKGDMPTSPFAAKVRGANS